jgi:hypothetical protein
VEGAEELRAASEGARVPCISCGADCGVWRNGVMDCAREAEEEVFRPCIQNEGVIRPLLNERPSLDVQREDEYGPIALLSRFWENDDAAASAEAAKLLQRPEGACGGEGWVRRAAEANARILALAEQWPERSAKPRESLRVKLSKSPLGFHGPPSASVCRGLEGLAAGELLERARATRGWV